MLRHMLFPLWVQSVEKYADRQPQDLLRAVAAGNAAANFLFCVNKVDQLDRMSGGDPRAPDELREDFAERIGRTLNVPPPRVWLLSATQPDLFDLPALREQLNVQRSDAAVKQGQALARRQQDRSLGTWLAAQDLPGRAQRFGGGLQQEAEELLADRVGTPLIERSLPALADDPSSRLALTDEVLAGRSARWPMVSLVHAVLTPAMAVVRRNVGVTRVAALPDAEAVVDAHLRPAGVPVATLVQNTFAQLQQTHPQVSDLYAGRRLWEDMPADAAAAALRTALTDTVARQRAEVRRRLGGASPIFAPVRWLLTIGAVLWFPFVQPAAERLTGPDGLDRNLIHDTHALTDLALHIVSVNDLLQSLTFLVMYFLLLWAVLRWDTQRRVARWTARWRTDAASDLSLTAQTVQWLDHLLRPIRAARERADTLAARAATAAEQRSAA